MVRARLEIVVATLVGVFFAGLVIGYIGPLILPKQTIYDKLHDAEIPYSKANWLGGHDLEYAEVVSQRESFRRFKSTYENMHNPDYSLPSWDTDVYVDDGWHVVWMKTIDTDTGDLWAIVFYVYDV